MTRATIDSRAVVLSAISEAQWDSQVMQIAARYRWELTYHTHDSRRSEAGFPDRVFVKGSRLLFVELKRQTGKVSHAQFRWLEALRQVPGIEVYIWRPSDIEEAERVLSKSDTLP